MNAFKGRHFGGEVILWAVRWYCRYGISFRDLEQMLAECGVEVDHTTIYRWCRPARPRWRSGCVASGVAGRGADRQPLSKPTPAYVP